MTTDVRRQARGIARREQILDAAFERFARDGVAATSLSDIASDCGITDAGLCHHFAGKDDLLLAVLTRVDARLAEIAAEIMAASTPRGVLENFHLSAELLVRDPRLTRLRVLVSASSVDRGGPVRDYVVARTVEIRRLIRDGFRSGMDSGHLRADLNADALAVEAIAFMEGIQLEWMLTPDDVDIVESYRAYARSLIERTEA